MKKLKKYQLVPQQKFYDSMSSQWRPFLMFNHFSNIRSKFCNTDIFGLRFNQLRNKKKKISIFDQSVKIKKQEAVIIGNSMSFGEGLTSDKKTISSHLSKKTKYQFYNLSGRGFSGFQELINFILHIEKFKNLKRIIIISGLNDSVLPYFIKNYDEELTPIFGYDRFKNGMLKATLGWKNKLFNFFLSSFFPKKKDLLVQLNSLNWKELLFKNKVIFESKKININPDNNLKKIFERNLRIWKIIGDSLNIRIDYILQPVATWCKYDRSPEESIIFHEAENTRKLKNVYKFLSKSKYQKVKKILKHLTKKYKINFFDLNQVFNSKKLKDKWIFSSKFHVNDYGSNYISDYIIKNVL